jgi:diaminohydroxyphosphoribosylaminopyrimidine deaminase/5-amino-6-(5-phosphoribosylamino)uracil reductase
MRVILDAGLRLPLRARILSTLEKGKILVFTNANAPPQKKEALEKSGVDVVSLTGTSPKIGLRQVLAELGRREVGSLLVEGGGKVATSFLEEKLADKVFLSISPRLIGGKDAIPIYGGAGAEHLRAALSLKTVSSFRVGGDMIVEGYL